MMAKWCHYQGIAFTRSKEELTCFVIQLPQSEEQDEAVIEIQLPVTRFDHPALLI
jgi:hypothetical protein